MSGGVKRGRLADISEGEATGGSSWTFTGGSGGLVETLDQCLHIVLLTEMNRVRSRGDLNADHKTWESQIGDSVSARKILRKSLGERRRGSGMKNVIHDNSEDAECSPAAFPEKAGVGHRLFVPDFNEDGL